MEEVKYTITFADGETLEGLTMNGNNYVSKTDFDEELLSDFNLMEVTVSDGESEATYHNMKKIHKTNYPNGDIYFTIEEKTHQELIDEEINSKIEYLAMMADIEMYDEDEFMEEEM